MGKVYVQVGAVFRDDGSITPVILWWKDGRAFRIDRVLEVRRAASLKAGGVGWRYKCRILGRERYLFYEDPAWFVETDKEKGGAGGCADGSP